MCWVGKKKKNIADNDILCYKILKKYDNELMSEYFHFVYRLKKLYKTYLDIKIFNLNDSDKVSIHEGFHSYSEDVVIKLHNYKSNATVSVSYGHRLFSHDFINCEPILVECIIPKGSIYYKNGSNEIVSNQIIINRIVKWEELKNT